jgi:hypothetical protein
MAIVCPTREPPKPNKPKSEPVVDPSELDAVSYHLQAACQAVRDLPLASVTREEFYNWIYHHIVVALNLVAEDNYCRRAGKPGPEPAPDEDALATDLDIIKG